MTSGKINKVRKNIIQCSQCDAEFPGGFEYREHWEKEHFYPYLKKNSFNFQQALKDRKRNYGEKD